MATRHDIVKGPSKFDVILSLFDGDHKNRRTVTFLLNEMITTDIVLNNIEREDGSGESWLFSGWCDKNDRRYEVNGHYSTRTRSGWVELA